MAGTTYPTARSALVQVYNKGGIGALYGRAVNLHSFLSHMASYDVTTNMWRAHHRHVIDTPLEPLCVELYGIL
jgi:hypothetical protein